MKKETWRRIMIMLLFAFNIFAGIYYLTEYQYEKVLINKDQSTIILKEAYQALDDFNRNLKDSNEKNLLVVPDYIESKEDFIESFNGKIARHIIEDFYEDLIFEKEHELFAKKEVYIPSIFAKDSYVENAYIEIKKDRKGKVLSKQLIIEERGKIHINESYHRKNFFIKNKEGKWCLDHFDGIKNYVFVLDEEEDVLGVNSIEDSL
ncbi:hypothetical protein [Inediibacterium massiliense]|uniref:hypothetical protein n=1 Tax=Inediibacterium massiliense TaxID=1658111 RepID=UPI0006B47D0A|nr:hypothetical protein [Inediibacterium massiliense]